VPRRLLSAVDSFTLYGNPVYCDCHLHSIFTDTCPDAKPLCSRHLLAGNRTRCAGPATVAGLTLLEALASDGNYNATTCGPVVTALFDAVIYLPTASTLRLDCRVTELTPRSSVIWITPGRRRRLHVEQSLTGTVLIIHHLESRDAGTYRCLAVDLNTNDSSSATTVLRIYNVGARVLPVFVGTTSVVITWSGTDSTFAAADYIIVYRLLPVHNLTARDTDRGAIHLRPYLRKYAINDLRPGATYEFCMTTQVAEHDRKRLHCSQLMTKPEVNSPTMIISGRLVGVVLVAVLTAMLVLRCACVRQRLRGAYRPASGTTADSRTRRSSSSSSLPLNQIISRQTDVDEHDVISSRTSLIGHVQSTDAVKLSQKVL